MFTLVAQRMTECVECYINPPVKASLLSTASRSKSFQNNATVSPITSKLRLILFCYREQNERKVINPFTSRVSYEDIKVILTSESVDEILWCDHSNETSSAVLSHGTIYISVFYKMKFRICLEFCF